MRRSFAILMSLFFLGSLLGKAAPFPDLPADHWATQAVTVLAEKGLVEGYPNGTFGGRRAATRYEVAMVVARLLATLEKEKPQVTQEDLNMIRRLVQDYKDELDAQGVRLSNVEKLLADLESRVAELERVKWSGAFETRYIADELTTCTGCPLSLFHVAALANGIQLPLGKSPIWNQTDLHLAERAVSPAMEGLPTDGAYPIVSSNNGSDLTQSGYLNVRAKIWNDYQAGGVVSLFNNVGYLGNGLVFGSVPDTGSNPFQAGTPAIFGTTNTNLTANVNQIYIENLQQDAHLAIGDWRPAYIPDFMLQGLPNLSIVGPDYLPFYGGQLYGTLHSGFAPGLSYEADAGRISVNNLKNYQNDILGGALKYSWLEGTKDGYEASVTGAYVRAFNDTSTLSAGTSGGVVNAGFWADPSTPTTFGSLNSNGGLGPQTVTMYGLDAKLHMGGAFQYLTLFGKWGNSKYQPIRGTLSATGVPLENVSGNLYNGGFKVDRGRLSFKGEYLWVHPKYDPFIAQIPIPTASFANSQPALWLSFPYAAAYGPPFTGFLPGPETLNFSSGNNNTNALTNGAGDVFYTLHDGVQYPNNRSGFRTSGSWDFGNSHFGGTYENLHQVNISGVAGELSPGFYDPIFFTINTYGGTSSTFTVPSSVSQANGPFRGRVIDYSLFGDYSWWWNHQKFTLNGLYRNSQIVRREPDFNNIDLLMDWWRTGLTYQTSNEWSFMGGYGEFNSGGAGDYLQPNVNTMNVTVPAQNINGTTSILVAPGFTMPANFRFTQRGPYVGANYNFAQNGSAWILYQMENLADNNGVGQAGFASHQVQSGLQILF